MDFLKDCARRLDAGESGERVLEDLRSRFTTPQCLNVKTSLVRSLCAPSKEFTEALDKLAPTLSPRLATKVRTAASASRTSSIPEVQEQLRRLPARLSPNARACRVSRAEKLQCKRSAASSVLAKNRTRHRAPGRELLCSARAIVHSPSDASVPMIALALMVLTGRRTCEVLNGSSSMEPVDDEEYAVRFRGQAKKRDAAAFRGGTGRELQNELQNEFQTSDRAQDPRRGGVDDEEAEDAAPSGFSIVIPTLAPAREIVATFATLREKQKGVVRDNRSTSLRYQSELGRFLRRAWPWSAVDHVHALRGLYVCMVLKLFDWGEAADAYVAMQLLGHARIQESLAYTPYDLGPTFSEEVGLGKGRLIP